MCREGDDVLFITQMGMLVRTPVAEISTIGRNTQGVRLVNLKDGDKLVALEVVSRPISNATPAKRARIRCGAASRTRPLRTRKSPTRTNRKSRVTTKATKGEPMALKEKLEADVKTAMLAKNEVVRDTLRLLLAELKRLDVQEGKHITPDIEQDVLLKAVKMRQQSIAEFEKAGRAELVAKEKAELAVIQTYLPKSLSDTEVEAAIRALMAELNVTSRRTWAR